MQILLQNYAKSMQIRANSLQNLAKSKKIFKRFKEILTQKQSNIKKNTFID